MPLELSHTYPMLISIVAQAQKRLPLVRFDNITRAAKIAKALRLETHTNWIIDIAASKDAPFAVYAPKNPSFRHLPGNPSHLTYLSGANKILISSNIRFLQLFNLKSAQSTQKIPLRFFFFSIFIPWLQTIFRFLLCLPFSTLKFNFAGTFIYTY